MQKVLLHVYGNSVKCYNRYMYSPNFLEFFEEEVSPKIHSRNPGGAIQPGEMVKFTYDEFGFCEHEISDQAGKIPWYRQ